MFLGWSGLGASQGQPCKQPMCFGGGAVFFFLGKMHVLENMTCRLGIVGRFGVDFDPKMIQNVPGPHCLR